MKLDPWFFQSYFLSDHNLRRLIINRLKVRFSTLQVKLAIILFFCFISIVPAAHPLVTDDAGTIGYKRFQVEITPKITNNETERLLILPVLSTYGLHDNLDLVFGFSSVSTLSAIENNYSFDQLEITLEVKMRLFETTNALFAIKPGLGLSNELLFYGSGSPDYSLFLITTHQFSKTSIYTNLSINKNLQKLSHASIALETPLVSDVSLVSNVGFYTHNKEFYQFVLFGFIGNFKKGLSLDAGYRFDMHDSWYERSFLCGLTIVF